MNRLTRKRKRRSVCPLRKRREDDQAADATSLIESASTSTSRTHNEQTEPSENSSVSMLPKGNGRSPSPARIVRLREHAELQNLNDRLSAHAAHVRELETENGRLRARLETMEGMVMEEIPATQPSIDQRERQLLQDSLNAAIQEKTQIESAREALKRERDGLVERLVITERQVSILQASLDKLEPLSTASTILEKELSSIKATLQHKLSEVDRLRGDLVNEQRKSRKLERDLALNKERYVKDMEVANARFVKTVSSSLASVREQHKRDLEALKREMTSVYQTKICEWKEKSDRSQADLLASVGELKTTKQENDDLKEQMTRIKAEKAAIEVQLHDACSRNEETKNQAAKERCQTQKEMALLSQELSEVKVELEEMGGVNNRLDGEISVYRVLLDDLENKNCCYGRNDEKITELDPMEVEVSDKMEDSNGTFKGHTTRITYTRVGDGINSGVKFFEVDHLGRYIRLSNETDHWVDLCLWMIQQTDHSSKKIQYEITSETRVSPGGCVTIWSQGQCPVEDESGPAESLASMVAKCVSSLDSYNVPGDRQWPTPNKLQLTMTGKSWLQIRGRCRFVLKDGDGQKQNECDVTVKPSDAGENVIGARGHADPKALNNINLLPGIGGLRTDEVTLGDTGLEDDIVVPRTSTTNESCRYGLLTTPPMQMCIDAFDPRGGGDGVSRLDKDSCVLS